MPMLRTLPEGSVGHEYARFREGWALDGGVGGRRKRGEEACHVVPGMARRHDLFLHFITGYAPFAGDSEMELAAFLHAQEGALRHLVAVFHLGLLSRRTHPGGLRRWLARAQAAHRRGARCADLRLVRWGDVLGRPLVEVRAELGLDDRPALPRKPMTVPRPVEIPRLAHVVLNTPDLDGSTAFYRGIFGLEVMASDPRLGVTFLSDGTDHHTLALGRSWGRGPRGWLRGIRNDLPAMVSLVAARRVGERSAQGKRPTMPPRAVVREHLRPGLNHIGYRVSSLPVLKEWYRFLRHEGVDVDWTVNHGDMILALYFLDPNGVRFEIFCDGSRAKQALADLAENGLRAEESAGAPRIDDFANWDLDLDAVVEAAPA